MKTKKISRFQLGGPQLALRHIMVNPALINALRSQKGYGCGPEIATFKGGESSSQLRWFTIAEIEL